MRLLRRRPPDHDWLEQRAAGSQPGSTSDLLALAEQIATFGPNARATGRVWSSRGSAERARKFGSVGLLLSGLVTVVSAVTPSIGSRLNAIDDVVPLPVHRAAFLVAAVTGLVLVQLASGVRRGQRRAWAIAVVVLVLTVAAHALKGLDIEESAAAAAVAIFLVVQRRYFRTPSDLGSLRRAIIPLLGTAAFAIVAGVVTIKVRRPRLSVRQSVVAVIERLVGVRSVPVHGRLDRFLSPAITGVGATLVVGIAWLLVRPALRARLHPEPAGRARDIVNRFGADTLAYFALRTDKQHWIYGDTLISYSVYNGVCLVSPDPIGPVVERQAAWAAFQTFTSDHGWHLGVLGAGHDYRGLYEGSGMRSLYVGDEGIVDVATFSLTGGAMKGLRQAVNRVANKAYTISFHDPATIDPALAASLKAMMADSRKGDVERGFSMTLSRLFDPDDLGLWLAVCHDPDGQPAAFCQFVPAGTTGFSLDLMRRAVGDHPNGLTDFVLVRTIERAATQGYRCISLNFATMRAVLAGEAGSGLGRQVERWALERLGGSMQIESLWKYNAKFQPRWQPRYLVYDSTDGLVPIALAVAKAESFWELPVIGAFLKPKTTRPADHVKRPKMRPSEQDVQAAAGQASEQMADIGETRSERQSGTDTDDDNRE